MQGYNISQGRDVIIWGSRGMSSTVSSGHFHCPRCGPGKMYDLIKVRRWFTLYFIPIFPISDDGHYVKCRACAGTFDRSAINYDPEQAQIEFDNQFDTGMVRSLLVLALAAPPVTDDALTAIAGLMSRIRNREIPLDKMRDLKAEVEDQKMTARRVLSALATTMNNSGKSIIARALVEFAPAPTAAQHKILEEACEAMGFERKAYVALLTPALTH